MKKDNGKLMDLKTRHEEFQLQKSKNDRSLILNSKRLAMASNQFENSADFKISSFYQNVTNKDEIINLIKQVSDSQPQPHLLCQFLGELGSKDCAIKTHGILSLRILFSKGQDYQSEELIAYDGLTPIFSLMQDFLYPHIQAEAAWIVSMIAHRTKDETHMLVNKGVVNILQKMLKCSFESVIEHVLLAIGNIAADCNTCRNAIAYGGIIESLGKLPEKFNSISIKKKITWITSSLCRLHPESETTSEVTKQQLACLINDFINTIDFQMMSDCIYGLSKHAKISEMHLFMNPDFLAKLRHFYEELMNQKDKQHISIILSTNEILNGISLCQDEHVLQLVNFGFLRCLLKGLLSGIKAYILDSLMILSNIVLGNENFIAAVMAETGLMDKVLLLSNDPDLKISKNAIWVISNMCHSAQMENIQNMTHIGVLGLFHDKLNMQEDPTILNLILEALESMTNFFEKSNNGKNNEFVEMLLDSGIASKIEELQQHPSELVYKKVINFMEKYFDCEK